MATAKWATPGTQSANFAGTTLDSLANGGTSAFVTYDNASNLDLQGSVLINLGSITPTTGGSITLRIFSTQSTDVPDNTGSVGGGDAYTQPLTTTTSAKVIVFPMVRLYPESLRFCVTNNAGVALAASGNSIKVRTFNESVVA
jgi:hypothetical protein